MTFRITFYVDDYPITASAKSEKVALAEAIELKIVYGRDDVTINDGCRSYSILEFAAQRMQAVSPQDGTI